MKAVQRKTLEQPVLEQEITEIIINVGDLPLEVVSTPAAPSGNLKHAKETLTTAPNPLIGSSENSAMKSAF